jgi:hypothetical protein
MLEAAKIGSVGSVCIVVKVLGGKFFFDVLETKNLTPKFDRLNPDKLILLTEKRKYDGSTLVAEGYEIDKEKLNDFFYLVRQWTNEREIYYIPYLCDKEKEEGFKPNEDPSRSCDHNLNFVPAIWIKNLPSSKSIDGLCTFEPILDMGIEIDYQLSQIGRLFKYNSDPTFVVKNPSSLQGQEIIKSVSVLNLDEKGDAYYAEMSGKSSESVMKFIKDLREYALEVVRGNRTSPEKMKTAQSGKAIQMLNSSLIGLVNEMRITYGDDGLICLYQMVLDILKTGKYQIDMGGSAPADICENHIILDWPDWYPKSSQEELQEQQTLAGYVENGLLSRETALKNIADEFNILDPQEELKTIESQENQEYNQKLKLKKQGKNAGISPKD